MNKEFKNSDDSVETYVFYIKTELDKLQEGRFTGNVEFKVNFRDGGIANMNCSLNKSVKMS